MENTRFMLEKEGQDNRDKVSFSEIRDGELFYCGNVYIKTTGIINEVVEPYHKVGYYNVFNLGTLRLGKFSRDTKVYRVVAEPFKYRVPGLKE